MNKKLTWDEIQREYPDQWVSLIRVEYTHDGSVKSGIVVAAGPDLKIVTRRLKKHNVESHLFEYTGLIKNFLGFAKWDLKNAETDR